MPKQGDTVALLFLFEGHEAAIPSIQAMQVGQRYFIRGWDDHNQAIDLSWVNAHYANLEIKPLDDGQLWYIPLAQGASLDFSDPVLAPFKNEIDVLNENLHTLSIIATADQSAMPKMQEVFPLLLPDRRTLAEPPGRSRREQSDRAAGVIRQPARL